MHVKEGIRAAGGTPMEFNTIAISDGVTMGTEGMKASLVSRELIADSIELVARGHMFDGIVALVACDKTIPGAGMALLRLNVPGVVLYGGTIMPGRYKGRDLTIQDVFEAVGANAAGKITDEDLLEIENLACPGAGACGGQFTANTMATVMELIGLSPMGTASVPQVDPRKDDVAFRCGEVSHGCGEAGPSGRATSPRARPSRTPSPAWPRPADRPMPCCTCSPWRAKPECRSNIDDFQTISERTPLLVDLKPGGKYVAVDVDKAGGMAGDRQAPGGWRLRRRRRHHRHRPTFARRSRGGQGNARPGSDPSARQAAQKDRRPGDSERQSRARRLRDQAFRARQAQAHRGPARVFDREEDAMAAVTGGRSSRATWW